jgi:UDP-GlcNAc:undecaprenyl-phosphate/decaprenyl-phosphate GlcNAc-1-phosphate transferase
MIDTLIRLHHVLGIEGMVCLLVVAASIAVAFLTTPHVRRLALHHGAMDNPGGRRVHKRVTARLGGLAVLFAILVGTILGLLMWPGTDTEMLITLSRVIPILLIGSIVCLFGALDDLTPISPIGKLTGLAVAGLLLGVSGVSIDVVTLPGLGRIEFGWFAIPATILWVLACTNAVNLIDGVDGSGAGVVTISALAMMLFALGLGDFTTGLLFAATCGAACGFLIHNRQPASIFLGDSGSLLLGFMLAASSAAGCTKSATALTLVGAVCALAVPFLDATQSFVRRFRASWLRGKTGGLREALRATAVADRGHIHHRLLFRGLSHREVSLVICLVTAVTSLTTLILLPTGQIHWTATVATLATGVFVLTRLGLVKARPIETDPAESSGEPSAEIVELPSAATYPAVRPTHPSSGSLEGGPQGMGTPTRRDPQKVTTES